MSNETFFGDLTFYDVLCIADLAYIGAGIKGLVYTVHKTKKKWQVYDVFEGVDYKFPVKRFQKHVSYRAILVNSLDNLNYKILAFSGSDSPFEDWGDWWMDNAGQAYNGSSPQYITAKNMAERLQPNLLIGHSLGGGLASYAAIHNGIPALTVNPAPLNIAASGNLMNKAYDKVFNFVAENEALDLLQKLSYQAHINESNFKIWSEFTKLSSICPNYKLADTIPYMRRVGRDVYKKSYGWNLGQKHLLGYFNDYEKPFVPTL